MVLLFYTYLISALIVLLTGVILAINTRHCEVTRVTLMDSAIAAVAILTPGINTWFAIVICVRFLITITDSIFKKKVS
jgi:hypothetical protein